MEKVELSERLIVTLVTPKCLMCGGTDKVRLTREEFAAMNDGLDAEEALPDRSTAFRTLAYKGTHESCQRIMDGEG